MVASYTVEGDAFHADKPRLWSETHFTPLARARFFALHPDGNRIVIAPAPEQSSAVKQDKVVLVFNFLDELHRIAPTRK